tara:strand:- start:60 stop:770 length:711 start_codon:yes stop_codon:yes gene_type:complete
MNSNIIDFKNNLSVIILCGGKGERLRPLTKNTPKPLVKIGSKTILEYIIEYLINNKISNIYIATGYKHKLINEFLKKKYKKKNKIRVINTGLNSDILTRIKKILQYTKDNILICYGDTLANVRINKLIKFSKLNKNKTLITSYRLNTQFGILNFNLNNLVFSFKEKPKLNLWFNIGYILTKKNKLSKYKKNDGFKNFINSEVKKKNLINFKHSGKHITVNTISELENAKKQIKNFS